MKNLFLFSLLLLFSTPVFSQNFLGMKVLKYGLTASNDQDRVSNLDAQYFMNLSKTPLETNLRDQDFSPKNLQSMTCENPALKASVTVLPFQKLQNIQLELGVNAMFNRIDATRYTFNYYGYEAFGNSYNFDSFSHEVALDAALLYNKKFGFLNFYGGVGANVGVTFAGSMYMSGTIYNEVENPGTASDDPSEGTFTSQNFSEYKSIKNVLHQRAFVQGGMSFIMFKRMELGIEARTGVGYRVNEGNPARATHLISGGLVAKWNLK